MNIPGFNAEKSHYTSSVHYQNISGQIGRASPAIDLAQLLRPPRNGNGNGGGGGGGCRPGCNPGCIPNNGDFTVPGPGHSICVRPNCDTWQRPCQYIPPPPPPICTVDDKRTCVCFYPPFFIPLPCSPNDPYPLKACAGTCTRTCCQEVGDQNLCGVSPC